jgi:hypothetical protein
MNYEIVPVAQEHIVGFHAAVDFVARSTTSIVRKYGLENGVAPR